MDTNEQNTEAQVNTYGFKSIIDLLKSFPDEQTCINHLESLRWNGVVVSPFDPNSQVYKCKGNRYKCRSTNKYFNVKTGTIFEDTKIPLQKWFMALYVFSSHKKGVSSHQLAKDISVTQKAAWFMLHRLRYAFNHPNFKKALGNEVEADETYVVGKEINKHLNKKNPGSTGGANKAPVLGLLERGRNVIAQKVKDTSGDSIIPIVYRKIENGSTLYTDEYKVYRFLHVFYDHKTVNHSAKEYVNGRAHITNYRLSTTKGNRRVY